MNWIKKIIYVATSLCLTTGIMFGMDLSESAKTGNFEQIYKAAVDGDESKVRQLIEAGANVILHY